MEVKIYWNNWTDDFVLLQVHNTIGNIPVNKEHLLLSCEKYNGYDYPIPIKPLIADTREKYDDFDEFRILNIDDKIKIYITNGYIGNQKNES